MLIPLQDLETKRRAIVPNPSRDDSGLAECGSPDTLAGEMSRVSRHEEANPPDREYTRPVRPLKEQVWANRRHRLQAEQLLTDTGEGAGSVTVQLVEGPPRRTSEHRERMCFEQKAGQQFNRVADSRTGRNFAKIGALRIPIRTLE